MRLVDARTLIKSGRWVRFPYPVQFGIIVFIPFYGGDAY